jgi:serine/threonine protein kinase
VSGSRAAFAADDVIGGYQLVRPAGKGGMAEVWLARKGGRGRPVALKVILPHLAGEARYSRMFRTEAEISGLMSHSNIVQIFDEGEDNGISYMVMEWVEGINLVRIREALKLIDNADVRTSMIAFVIGQLLHALSYAHQLTDPSGTPLGIVHRDISPQNVLVSTAGDVKLFDFGVAHTVIEESSGMHVKGKLRYMAPEQLTTRTKAPTLDLFGVGALLHELLDGKRFRGDFKDDRQLHAQVMRGIVPALRNPVAPELERLRQSLLAQAPASRPQSAEAALAMLRQYRGYRDCRVELSKVVGSLSGSSRPRSAVEPSQAAAASMPAPGPAMPSPSMPAPAWRGPACLRPVPPCLRPACLRLVPPCLRRSHLRPACPHRGLPCLRPIPACPLRSRPHLACRLRSRPACRRLQLPLRPRRLPLRPRRRPSARCFSMAAAYLPGLWQQPVYHRVPHRRARRSCRTRRSVPRRRQCRSRPPSWPIPTRRALRWPSLRRAPPSSPRPASTAPRSRTARPAVSSQADLPVTASPTVPPARCIPVRAVRPAPCGRPRPSHLRLLPRPPDGRCTTSPTSRR